MVKKIQYFCAHVTDYWQQVWAGFMLLLTLTMLIFAWSELTLFSGFILLCCFVLTAWLAWRWAAMQISVVMIAVLSVLVLLTNTANQLNSLLLPALSILLPVSFLLALVVDLGKTKLTHLDVSYLCWSVMVGGVVLFIVRGISSPALNLQYISLPLTNIDEFLILLTLLMVFIYLSFARSHGRVQGAFIGLLPAVLMSCYLTTLYFGRELRQPVMPDVILSHGLLLVHVPAMILAFALFISAAGFAVLRLLSDTPWLRARQNRDVLETVQTSLEDYLYRLLSLAVMAMGLGLFTGMLWSNLSWGHYWLAEPKQLVSLAVWLYYMAGLHLRLQKGLQRRAFAWWCVMGLPLLLLSLLGTNLGSQGLHSFGNL